jgi:hypothetical protein
MDQTAWTWSRHQLPWSGGAGPETGRGRSFVLVEQGHGDHSLILVSLFYILDCDDVLRGLFPSSASS